MSINDAERAYVEVLEMLHRRSLEDWEIPGLMREVAECLGTLGMQLCRIHIGRPILHPLYVIGAYTWYPDNKGRTRYLQARRRATGFFSSKSCFPRL